MSRQFRWPLIGVVFVLTMLLSSAAGAQFDASATTQSAVALVKLHDPVFPQIARLAGVAGDVHLVVHVRQDGSVESVEYISGPPLLKLAAMKSAEASEFECVGCTPAVTEYSLTYSFELTGSDCCNGWGPPQVSRIANHVSIVAGRICFCDPVADVVRERSIKCLYLWKCATK